MKRFGLAAAAACALAWTAPAYADEAQDLAAIKAQLNAMDHEYREKIASLEVRLKKAEADAASARAAATKANTTASTAVASARTAQAAAQQVAEAAPAAAAPTPPASNNAFNPGIAAVLNGFYAAVVTRSRQAAHSWLRCR